MKEGDTRNNYIDDIEKALSEIKKLQDTCGIISPNLFYGYCKERYPLLNSNNLYNHQISLEEEVKKQNLIFRKMSSKENVRAIRSMCAYIEDFRYWIDVNADKDPNKNRAEVIKEFKLYMCRKKEVSCIPTANKPLKFIGPAALIYAAKNYDLSVIPAAVSRIDFGKLIRFVAFNKLKSHSEITDFSFFDADAIDDKRIENPDYISKPKAKKGVIYSFLKSKNGDMLQIKFGRTDRDIHARINEHRLSNKYELLSSNASAVRYVFSKDTFNDEKRAAKIFEKLGRREGRDEIIEISKSNYIKAWNEIEDILL